MQTMESFTTAALFAELFDHTLLRADATQVEIGRLCQEALQFGFKGVCVNPVHIPFVSKELAGSGSLPVTVIGFPLGANATSVKCKEALQAIEDGARELDMVINLGAWKGGDSQKVREDIAAVIRAAAPVPVKVIIETAYLNAAEITELTKMVAQEGAVFIKTSTGFGPRGASVEDINIMSSAIPAGLKLEIKASGGIKNLDQLQQLVRAGASRIGSSASVAIFEEYKKLQMQPSHS